MTRKTNQKPISWPAFIWLTIMGLLSLPLVASFFGASHPAFDSFGHLRRHMALVLIIGVVPLLFTKGRRAALGLGFLAFFALYSTLQTGGIRPHDITDNLQKTSYKLIQSNLRFDNKTPHKLAELIAAEKPDFITFEEASSGWQPTLEKIAENGYFLLQCNRGPKTAALGGTGILSRFPFIKTIPKEECPTDGAMIYAFVDLGNQREMKISAMHLHWPWPFKQKVQLDSLTLTTDQPQLVSGDFNAVTWSQAVKDVENRTGTRHVSGIHASWLSYKVPAILRPYLGLPIDQVLVSNDIHVQEMTTLPAIGSDHLPIMTRFIIDKGD